MNQLQRMQVGGIEEQSLLAAKNEVVVVFAVAVDGTGVPD